MTFNGRRHSMGDNLWWKRTFDGRQTLMEDDLWWKMTLDGRRPLMEDDLWWKMTFDGRRPLMGDDLWWKRTIDGRRALMEDDGDHNVFVCTRLALATLWLLPPRGHFLVENFVIFFQGGKTHFHHETPPHHQIYMSKFLAPTWPRPLLRRVPLPKELLHLIKLPSVKNIHP